MIKAKSIFISIVISMILLVTNVGKAANDPRIAPLPGQPVFPYPIIIDLPWQEPETNPPYKVEDKLN